MSRDRFLLILRFGHFGENKDKEERLGKVNVLTDHINDGWRIFILLIDICQ